MLDASMPPKKSEGFNQFNIRMPKALLDALDEEVDAERVARPGRTFTRSDLIREILFEHIEARRAKPPKKK